MGDPLPPNTPAASPRRRSPSVEAKHVPGRAWSEARERSYLQAALDCVVMADEFGRIVEFNPSAERVFGYTRSEVLGRTMTELIVPPGCAAGTSRPLPSSSEPDSSGSSDNGSSSWRCDPTVANSRSSWC